MLLIEIVSMSLFDQFKIMGQIFQTSVTFFFEIPEMVHFFIYFRMGKLCIGDTISL